MIYLELFWSFLKIGLFSFGGGYAAMPLIQEQVVSSHDWLSMAEFTDLITISQMTPGPIAINSATFVGIKIAGIPGALVSTIGCILPSCIIVMLIAKLYLKYRTVNMLQSVLNSLRACSGGYDRICRYFSPDHSILGKCGTDFAGRDKLDFGHYFCRMRCSAPKIQNESDPCHGAGRCSEGGGIFCGIINPCRKRILDQARKTPGRDC